MVRFERVYLDTSVIGRRTFNQPGALHDVVWDFGIASEIIALEMSRTLDNFGITTRPPAELRAQFREIADRNLAHLNLIPLDKTVLKRAGSGFPTPLGSLDAIHLATALLWVEHNTTPLTLLTHDRQLSTAARACGLPVYPV